MILSAAQQPGMTATQHSSTYFLSDNRKEEMSKANELKMSKPGTFILAYLSIYVMLSVVSIICFKMYLSLSNCLDASFLVLQLTKTWTLNIIICLW